MTTSKPVVVSFVKVLSNSVEDVSSLEAWRSSLHDHGVAEVGWGNAWHMFDAAYIDLSRRRRQGRVGLSRLLR